MSVSKAIARKFVFPLLLNLKVDKLLMAGSPKHLIINFHGVTNVIGNRFNNRHLDVNEFEKIIKYLKTNFEIVPLAKIFELHRSKQNSSKRTIAITFDDGYENNFTQALPVLKKYEVPATFYLISKGLVDKDFYVWPDLIDLVQREATEDIPTKAGVFKYPGFYCETLKLNLVDYIKQAGSKRDEIVADLVAKYPSYKKVYNKDPQLIELIRKESLRAYINEPLIEFGSHSHAHYNLEYLTAAECEFELKESKRIIEEQTARNVISLAFPDSSYNQNTIDNALKLDYKNMVAVDYKLNEGNKKEFILSRFTISNSTTFESNMIRMAKQFKTYGF